MEPNAILAINSLDRYNKNQGVGGQFASFSTSLVNQYNTTGQPCNNFTVGGFGALIYGYIKKIQVSQIQLQYNVPTIIPNLNDTITILVYRAVTLPPYQNPTPFVFTFPFGFYTPQELAATFNLILNNSVDFVNVAGNGVIVSYSPLNGFIISVNQPIINTQIAFPDVPQIQAILNAQSLDPELYLNILKTYRVFGIDKSNSFPVSNLKCSTYPNFLYTPYVDIFSTSLTKYQKVKDNTTSASSDSTLVARIYLAGTGGPQNSGGDQSVFKPTPTEHTFPLGSRPFIVVQDCNTPKVVRWSKDETVYNLDFQLRDQYGDLLYTTYNAAQAISPINPDNSPVNQVYYTEFQMTLMCIEGGSG